MPILKFDMVPMFLHAVRIFIAKNHFQANMCQHFLPRNYDVISQLRHSYAKGPFCVARLILLSGPRREGGGGGYGVLHILISEAEEEGVLNNWV